jgi:methylthioxylose transferase
MQTHFVRFGLGLLVGMTLVALLLDRIPLGVPGEWTWARHALNWQTFLGGIVVATAGAGYLAFVWLGLRRVDRCSLVERWCWLAGLVGAAFAWMGMAVSSTGDLGHGRVPWVLYYPRTSGYFFQARYEADSAGSFLAGYEELLSEQDYLHIGTHPPGLTLGYLGLLRFCESLPWLTDALLATQPDDVAESIALIRRPSDPTGALLRPADAACLWLAGLLTQLAAALACLGIYGLTARHFGRGASWTTASLWPLVPAVIVFFPKSDVLYPLVAVIAAWLWMTACDRSSILRAVLAGVVLWSGMMLSLAFLSIAALIGVMTLWEAWTRRSHPAETSSWLSFRNAAAAVAGFLVPCLTLAAACDINLWNVWGWNFSNHALFYEHNSRTRWAWLLVNPAEFAMAVGLPLSLIAVLAALRQFRGAPDRSASAAVALAVVWGLLWVSGKNMGEAARLWILLMPWVLMSASCLFEEPREPTSLSGPRLSLPALFGSQLVVVIVTVLTVDGFHFSDLIAG